MTIQTNTYRLTVFEADAPSIIPTPDGEYDVTFAGENNVPSDVAAFLHKFALRLDEESCTHCNAPVGSTLYEDERGLGYNQWSMAYIVVQEGRLPGQVVLCEDCIDTVLD